MNTLSLHINKAVEYSRASPLKICRGISISHNLFVDDIILFGMLCKNTWACFFVILDNFQKATGLKINSEKSAFFHNSSSQEMIDWLSELFGINAHPIGRGPKYLGFQLKANGYKKEDWGWILDKYHKRISGWQYRYLSLGGRVILAQPVLNQMMVYWAHLFAIPTSIISAMNKLTASFIWGDRAVGKKYHLSSLANLSKPKALGGWGLLDLKSFNKALLCRMLWRGVFEDGPWSCIIRGKYLRRRSLARWFGRKQLGSLRGSPIWQSLWKIGMFFWKIYPGIFNQANIFSLEKTVL